MLLKRMYFFVGQDGFQFSRRVALRIVNYDMEKGKGGSILLSLHIGKLVVSNSSRCPF